MKILTGKSIKDIWEKNRTEFLSIYAHEQEKPIGFEKLEKRFVDSNGKQYYGFPKTLPMPLERFGHVQDTLMWMASGLTGKELRSLIDVADKALMDGLKNGKNAAKIGFTLEEMKMRENMVIHTELLYNFLAYCVVREDEKIDVVDKEIHLQKVAQFKEETANGNSYFFFRKPELENLSWLSRLTESEWAEYFQKSQVEQQALKERLKIVSSSYESEPKKKTQKKES